MSGSGFFGARVAVVFLLFLAGGVFAQTAGTGEGVFSPFVSALTAEIRNNLVRLSWADSPDARGPVFIFRSTRPFTGTNPADLRPVEVAYGARSYVDETDGAGPFYYFVAASDIRGQRYDIFIPYTNTVAVFSQTFWEDDVPARAAAPGGSAGEQVPGGPVPSQSGSGRSVDPVISGLAARSEGEGVVVSFTISGNPKSAVLYRNTRPIRRIQDLLSAIIVQTEVISPFIDYPAPGASYYYAILFEDDIARGAAEVQPGRNATTVAAEVTGRARETAPDVRSMPLPALSVYKTSPGSDYYSEILERAAGGDSREPPQRALRPETQAAISTIPQARPEQLPAKRPRVFARDLEVPSGGEESGLRTIVQGTFAKREWQSAHEELLRYLSLPHSAGIEARARFYLGQTYYFSGRNREALIEFLFVQGRYPNEANEWIEAALAALAR